MSDILKRLKRSCDYKSATAITEGISNKKLKEIAKEIKPSWPVHTLSRERLLNLVCGHACPANTYKGADNIIADIDFGPDVGFTYKGVPINVEQTPLASGSYGEVFQCSFTYNSKLLYFVIKRSTSNDGTQLEEAIVAASHIQALKCPGIIGIKILHLSGEAVALMPMADGDLRIHCGSLSHKQALQIIKVIKKALHCLYENGNYYYDIKPANILYTCNSNGIASIFLADMGSIIPTDDGHYLASHPPPQWWTGFIENTSNALAEYEYQLACLYCWLVSGQPPPSHSMTHDEYLELLINQVRETRRFHLSQNLPRDNEMTKLLESYVSKMSFFS